MRFVRIAVILIVGILFFLKPVRAEEHKLAYINSVKVFSEYYKTEEADKKLEEKGKKKNAERDKLVESINKLKDEIELLSEKAGKEKREELEKKMRDLQDFDREAKLSLKRERDDMVKEIFGDIDEKIRVFAKKRGYSVIFDSRLLLYADDSLDVTDEFIRELNKR